MANLNIIIGTHGRFGEEIIKSAEMIVGKMENVRAVSLLPEMSFEEFMKQVKDILAELEGETIALVDLYGGTPCNVLTALTRSYNHNVITGLNLPMLIDLYINTSNAEEIDVKQAVENCINNLRESGVHTNSMLD
jgi:PTS system mannose-specific IIA component/D-glucosaminate-specific PTS system IIA component